MDVSVFVRYALAAPVAGASPQVRNESFVGFLIIATIYTVGLLLWLQYDGGDLLDLALLSLLGIPLAAGAVWWSGRDRRRRP